MKILKLKAVCISQYCICLHIAGNPNNSGSNICGKVYFSHLSGSQVGGHLDQLLVVWNVIYFQDFFPVCTAFFNISVSFSWPHEMLRCLLHRQTSRLCSRQEKEVGLRARMSRTATLSFQNIFQKTPTVVYTMSQLCQMVTS